MKEEEIKRKERKNKERKKERKKKQKKKKLKTRGNNKSKHDDEANVLVHQSSSGKVQAKCRPRKKAKQTSARYERKQRKRRQQAEVGAG